jgi:hypothetical protein
VRCFPRAALGAGMRAYEAWLASVDSPERVRREAFVECPVAHPTLAIRAELLRAFGYRDRGWPEDYDLLLRLLEAGHRGAPGAPLVVSVAGAVARARIRGELARLSLREGADYVCAA